MPKPSPSNPQRSRILPDVTIHHLDLGLEQFAYQDHRRPQQPFVTPQPDQPGTITLTPTQRRL